ncbi:MAG: hypothetical protein AB8G26_07895 [Ilumatobacter sp.]
MLTPDDRAQSDAITAVTRAGMLVYGAWAFFLLWAIDRAVRTGATRFAGAWVQRLEALAFITMPPNAPVLFIAAALAAWATWQAGATQSLELAILLRLIRWSANVMVILSFSSAVSILVTDTGGPDERATFMFRLGGTLFAAATSYLCLAAGRNAPGG